VKEFAHLKWGLFDEDVSITDLKTPVFYLFDGSYQPTRLEALVYADIYFDYTHFIYKP